MARHNLLRITTPLQPPFGHRARVKHSRLRPDPKGQRGWIKGRSGDTVILQTSDSPNLVVLTDSTDV